MKVPFTLPSLDGLILILQGLRYEISDEFEVGVIDVKSGENLVDVVDLSEVVDGFPDDFEGLKVLVLPEFEGDEDVG